MSSVHWVTLGDVCRENARRFPQYLATVDGDRRHTYPQLDERVTRLGNALRRLGMGPGGRVLWLGQNSARLLELILAAGKVGFIVCPVNWRLTPVELQPLVEKFAPRVVVWQEAETGATAAALRERISPGACWVQHDSDAPGSYESLLAGASADDADEPLSPDLPCLAMYTAAFEGVPRAALITHTGLMHSSLVNGYLRCIGAGTVFLNVTPWFHIGVYRWAMPTFVFGGTNVFLPRAHAAQICRVIAAEHVTDADLYPVTQQQMVEANAGGLYDLTSLRSPPGDEAWHRMTGIVPPARPVTGWGQTETTGQATATTLGGDAIGRHGRSMPFALVRILDADGQELPVGEIGEIAVRGPTVMRGYLDTQGTPGQDGAGQDSAGQYRAAAAGAGAPGARWHRSNDLGRREPDGSVTFIGPKGRLLKSGLENIYPAEIEACLRTHPQVADVAVIGIPDRKFVQAPKAIVLPADEAAPPAAGDLVRFLRERIAGYKVPKAYAFVSALPRVQGRLDYATLDREHGGGAYPGGATPTR